jgi:hypothetical protein
VKCRAEIFMPRLAVIYPATGESIPPDSKSKALPFDPTGIPPAPRYFSVDACINAPLFLTSTVTRTSGFFKSTFKIPLYKASPTCTAISGLFTGNLLSDLFAATPKLFLPPRTGAIYFNAASFIFSMSFSTLTAEFTVTIPNTFSKTGII